MQATRSYRFGDFELDVAQRRLSRNGEEVRLQPRVYETLLYLVERSQRVVPKDELLEAVWEGTFVTENALSRCIRQIRRAMEDSARSPVFVRTVPRVGYQFVGNLDNAAEIVKRRSERSIAVLPFRSLTGVADEGLELGMADTLITRLTRAQKLLVRPLSATRRYSVGEQSPLDAGAEQDTDLVIDGAIQRAGNRVRVSARLTRVSDGHTLWAEQFDRPVDEIFAVQDAICRQIIDALHVDLTGRERRQMTKRHTSSPEAYRSYLLGRLHFSKHTPEAARRSVEYFESAIDLDPTYALAWAGLAEALDTLGTLGIEPSGFYERMRRAATRARKLDDEFADPLRSLAKIAWQHDWEWAEADRLFRQALELDAHNAESWIAYSDFCCHLRRANDGETHAREALAIDPVSPWVNAMLAQALHMQGRHAEALRQAERALEIDPEFAFARLFAGFAAIGCGQGDEAIRHLEAAFEASGRPDFAGPLAYAHISIGQSERARSILTEMQSSSTVHPVPPIVFATLETALGDFDAAFQHLERCFEQKSWHVLLVYAEPIFASLRRDPRSTDLFRRLGLPLEPPAASAQAPPLGH